MSDTKVDIRVETVDIILTRISEHKFQLKVGDIALEEDVFDIRVLESITIPVPAMLVMRQYGITKTVTFKEA